MKRPVLRLKVSQVAVGDFLVTSSRDSYYVGGVEDRGRERALWLGHCSGPSVDGYVEVWTLYPAKKSVTILARRNNKVNPPRERYRVTYRPCR